MAHELELEPGWLRKDGEAAKAAIARAPERLLEIQDHLASIGIDRGHGALLAKRIAPFAAAPLDGIRIMFSGRLTTVLDERHSVPRVICQIAR